MWKIGPRLALHESLSIFFYTSHPRRQSFYSQLLLLALQTQTKSSSFFATRSSREVLPFEIRLWVLPCYPFYAGKGMLDTVYTNTFARVYGGLVEKLIKEDICVRKLNPCYKVQLCTSKLRHGLNYSSPLLLQFTRCMDISHPHEDKS